MTSHLTRKPCIDIAVGDTIVFLGEKHVVTHFAGPNAFGWRIAKSGADWGISLDPAGSLDVLAVAA